jgi:hypothetical protein
MAKVTDAKIPSDNLPDGTDKNPYLGTTLVGACSSDRNV